MKNKKRLSSATSRRPILEPMELRNLLAATPTWSDPILIQDGIDNAIYAEAFDVDLDGKDDLLVAGPNVLLYRSNGDGAFGKPTELTFDGMGYGMTLASDADGDNDLDIVASSSSNGIFLIRNHGDGTFAPAVSITDSKGIIRIAVADIEGDGDSDVISASYSGKRLAWHRNQGDGSYAPDQVIAEGVDGLYSVDAADLNGDSIPEIVTAEFGEDNSVAVYTATGETFSRTTISNNLNAPLAVEIADFDGDGDQDVAAGAYYGNQVVWYANNGSATFDSAARPITDNVGGPFRLRAADWDNDGDLDLVSVSTKDDKVAFHENLGGQTFATQDVLFDNWSSPTAGSPADIDGDGDLDLVVASYADDALLWVRNDTIRAGALLNDIGKYVTTEHVDLSLNFRESQWHASVDIDEADGSTREYRADEAVLFVSPAAIEQRPAGSQWDFTGVAEGGTLWTLPQQRDPQLPFVGIAVDNTDSNTFARYFENDPRIQSERDWVRFQLLDVRGPEGGDFGIYESITFQGGTIVKNWMTTADGVSPQDSFWQREGSHSHVSFFFTKPGVYEVDLRGSGFIDVNDNRVFDPGLDFYSESDVATFHFAVQPPNQAPVVSVPGLIRANGGERVSLNGSNAILVTDTERDGGNYEVALSAKGGGLTVVAGADVQFLQGDGVDDDAMVLRGPLAAINKALTSLQFLPTATFQGLGTIQVTANDGGFFHPDLDGDGVLDNAKSASATLVISVDSSAPDFNHDGTIGEADIHLACRAALSGDEAFDLNANGHGELEDVAILVDHVFNSFIGDADLNGIFDSSDLVLVFQRGKYEMLDQVASWSDGDWTCDGRFDTADLIFAFSRGGFRST